MTITKIIIQLTRLGPDCVTLHTDLPSTMPNVTKQNMQARFDVSMDCGIEYVKSHFKVNSGKLPPVTVINERVNPIAIYKLE